MTLIPLYLTSSIDEEPTDSLTSVLANTKVSIDGAALVAAGGTVTEVGGTGEGRGAYVYESTAAEESGNTLLVVVDGITDVAPYAFFTRFPLNVEMNAGSTLADTRRVFFDATDSLGNPLLLLDESEVDFGQLTVSINGAAWTDNAGDWSEIGRGFYSLVMDPSQLAKGLVMVHAEVGSCSTRPFVYAFYVGGIVVTPITPTPIGVPVVFGDPTYRDVTLIALNRLAQQFRSRP